MVKNQGTKRTQPDLAKNSQKGKEHPAQNRVSPHPDQVNSLQNSVPPTEQVSSAQGAPQLPLQGAPQIQVQNAPQHPVKDAPQPPVQDAPQPPVEGAPQIQVQAGSPSKKPKKDPPALPDPDNSHFKELISKLSPDAQPDLLKTTPESDEETGDKSAKLTCGWCVGYQKFVKEMYDCFSGDEKTMGIGHQFSNVSIPLEFEVLRRDSVIRGSKIICDVVVGVADRQDESISNTMVTRAMLNFSPTQKVDLYDEIITPDSKCRKPFISCFWSSVDDNIKVLRLRLDDKQAGLIPDKVWIRHHKNPALRNSPWFVLDNFIDSGGRFLRGLKLKVCEHIWNRMRSIERCQSDISYAFEPHIEVSDFQKFAADFAIERLDDDQVNFLDIVVNKIWRSIDLKDQQRVVVLQGPAGTSKTTVVIMAANILHMRSCLVEDDHWVIYLAETHEAVVKAFEMCYRSRLGWQEREMQMMSFPPRKLFNKLFPDWQNYADDLDGLVTFAEEGTLKEKIVTKTLFSTTGTFNLNKKMWEALQEKIGSGRLTIFMDESEIAAFSQGVLPLIMFGNCPNVRIVFIGDTHQTNPSEFKYTFWNSKRLAKSLSIHHVLEYSALYPDTIPWDGFRKLVDGSITNFALVQDQDSLTDLSKTNDAVLGFAADIGEYYGISLNRSFQKSLEKVLAVMFVLIENAPVAVSLIKNFRCPPSAVALANEHVYLPGQELIPHKQRGCLDDAFKVSILCSDTLPDFASTRIIKQINVTFNDIRTINLEFRKLFYDGICQSDSPLCELQSSKVLGDLNLVMVHADAQTTAGTPFGTAGSVSYPEAACAIRFAVEMACSSPVTKEGKHALAICTPYNSQRELLQYLVRRVSKGCPPHWGVSNILVYTSSSVTGNEFGRVIFLPCVLGQVSGNYSDNSNLNNVAMTRHMEQNITIVNGAVFGLVSEDHSIVRLLKSFGRIPSEDITVVDVVEANLFPDWSSLVEKGYGCLSQIKQGCYQQLTDILSTSRSAFFGSNNKSEVDELTLEKEVAVYDMNQAESFAAYTMIGSRGPRRIAEEEETSPVADTDPKEVADQLRDAEKTDTKETS